MPKTIELPPLDFARAAMVPDSLKESERTVDVVVSTEAFVRRYHPAFYEVLNESLEITTDSLRLDYFNSGQAPILDIHNSYDLKAVYGKVLRAWIENHELIATIRYDENKESEEVWQRVKRGELPNYSVRGRVHKYSDVTVEGDTIRSLVAVDWEPREVSIVPMGADDGAVVRSAKPDFLPCIIEHAASADNEGHMPKPITPIAPAAPAVPVEPDSVTRAAHEAAIEAATVAAKAEGQAEGKAEAQGIVDAERARVTDVRDTCRKAGMSDAFIDKHVSLGTKLAAVNSAVIEEIAQRSDDNPIRNRATITTDERDTVRAGLEMALDHRAAPGEVKLDDNGKRFHGMTLVEVARAALKVANVNVDGLHGMAFAERAFHSTSDFPIILANTANKSMLRAYEAAPKTYEPFSRRVTLGDFKPATRVKLGDAPTLDLVTESGEFKRGTISEDKETIQLLTYGKIFGLTRQAMINDDMDALTRMPQLFGRGAADKQNALMWAVLTANASMNDGVALFHNTHGNLGSGVINIANLTAARLLMRKQTGLDGAPLHVLPKYLLVPAALEGVAEQFLFANVAPTQASEVNPFAGKVELIVEPLLDATSALVWYVAADPARIDTLEYGFLNGSEGLQMETRNGFDVDGFEIKARLDFGVKAIEHRGLVKSTGA